MGLGLSGSAAVGNRNMTNEGVRTEASGKISGAHHVETDLQAVKRVREDGGIQQIPTVVGPRTRPHTGGEGSRVK